MSVYTVTERITRQAPNGPTWEDVTAFVVVDELGREVTDLTEVHAVAEKWCGWLNAAHERGRAKLVEEKR